MNDSYPWCSCRKCPGYCSLRDKYNTFVCGSCLKPSWGVYVTSEKKCKECGGSFYSPWEIICSDCRVTLLDLAVTVQADGASAADVGLILTGVNLDGWLGWIEQAESLRRDPFKPYDTRELTLCPWCNSTIQSHDAEQAAACHVQLVRRRQVAKINR